MRLVFELAWIVVTTTIGFVAVVERKRGGGEKGERFLFPFHFFLPSPSPSPSFLWACHTGYMDIFWRNTKRHFHSLLGRLLVHRWEWIKWSPTGKCVDLYANSLDLFFKEMYGKQFREFVCGSVGPKGLSSRSLEQLLVVSAISG